MFTKFLPDLRHLWTLVVSILIAIATLLPTGQPSAACPLVTEISGAIKEDTIDMLIFEFARASVDLLAGRTMISVKKASIIGNYSESRYHLPGRSEQLPIILQSMQKILKG